MAVRYINTCLWSGVILEKLLRGSKIEVFVSEGGHACVSVHALSMCVCVFA